jgi:hypothetical protein
VKVSLRSSEPRKSALRFSLTTATSSLPDETTRTATIAPSGRLRRRMLFAAPAGTSIDTAASAAAALVAAKKSSAARSAPCI